MKTKAIVINEYGDTSAMQWQEIDLPDLQADEVLVKIVTVSFNMIDTYFRKGLYPMEKPFVLGAEAVGVIEAIGTDVIDFDVGDRVASVQPKEGAYAQYRVLNQASLIKVPDNLDDDTVAASLLKGMTAQYLLKQTYQVQAGDTIVVYAAAGGVGSILTQWAKHLGARVIGITSTKEKAALATQQGADFVINTSETPVEKIAEQVLAYTNGQGVPVVYDSLGKDTFYISLDCLQQRGLLVSYGNATGAVSDVNLLELAKRGSLYVTRPILFDYISKPGAMKKVAEDLFAVIEQGIIKIEIGQQFALKDAAQAHLAAESRATTGSTILKP